MKKAYLIILVVLIVAGTVIYKKIPHYTEGTLKDVRDGHIYKTVIIGDQEWMAENLCYDNPPETCQKYGGLYNWERAMRVCPAGWELPSLSNWDALWEIIGGKETAGNVLKTQTGWNNNGNGSDSWGFSVVPAGARGVSGNHIGKGEYTFFWLPVIDANKTPLVYSFSFNTGEAVLIPLTGNAEVSVRCISI